MAADDLAKLGGAILRHTSFVVGAIYGFPIVNDVIKVLLYYTFGVVYIYTNAVLL